MQWLLIRTAYWLRRPPARWQLWVAAGVILLAAALYLFERQFGWPDWLTVNPRGRGPLTLR